ncbi:MAG: hypothetical protein QOE35_2892 [Actinomycetota bacterium]|jgi:hypothetical protein
MQRRWWFVVVLVLGSALAACGGSGDNPVKALRASATKTVAAGSARSALTLVTSAQPGGTKTTKGTGAIDFAAKRATFAIDTSSLGLAGLSGTVDLVLAGGVIYAKLPSLLPGKPWLKLDPKTLGAAGTGNLGGLGDLASGDPAAGIRFLDGIAGGATKVGSEQVRGVATTHYRGAVDLEKVKAAASTSAKASVDALIKQLGKATYPVDVWLDKDGLVRRLRSRQATAASGTTPGATVVRTEEYYDFGAKVTAEPPAADQVTDLADLLQGAGQK